MTMDPISKALERAQSEKPSARDWVRPTRPADNVEEEQSPRLEESSIETVDFDSEVLRNHHILCGDKLDDLVVRDRYRVLRTRVLQLMRQNHWKTLGVTSPGASAGKTLTSINLCMSLVVDSSNDVILLDADLRNSSLASDLGVPVQHGIVDYLASDELIPEDVLLQHTRTPNLKLFPGRRVGESATTPELLNSTRMAELIVTLRDQSESTIVVVDLPPVFVGDDVISLAPLLDCFLLLIDGTSTKIDELSEAVGILAEHNLLGTVLNKSEARGHTFGGYYQSGAPE
jgi:Mrp family chromosome partitioning ATPase|tara:strand:- start:789 stop:1649 length:861 start_codon:yes stop_codon:yes gene_type:complete